ncbi:hypothetical protein Tco_0735865 [Tanacetum coccineum]
MNIGWCALGENDPYLGVAAPIGWCLQPWHNDTDRLRVKVFPHSLADDAKQWWIDEWDGKITAWGILVGRFFCKYFPLSRNGKNYVANSNNADELGYYELMAWLDSRLDDMRIDRCMTKSYTKELLSHFENPEQKFCSRKRLFDTPSLVESNSPEFDHISDIEEQSGEEVSKTMEQYMSKTRGDYGSGVTRPTINQDTHFELKGQFFKEIHDNTFSGLEHEDSNEHIEKVLEIGAIPSKTAADAKIAIQEMAEYSKKWHNGTSLRTKFTETSDELAAIQAQLNNLRREIKKVNEKVYVAQRPSLQESLTKFMTESAKMHEENSNIIKEIIASTDAAIRNQGASIKTLEIKIGQMSKVLQERGFGSLPSSTEKNPRDQVKLISTAKADFSEICRIECGPYAVSGTQHKSVSSKIVLFPRRLQNFGCDD